MDRTVRKTEEIEDFRRRLVRAFPPHPYHGPVSAHDECDDGIHLRRELPGKRWDDLSPDVLFHGSIALPLLDPEALVAFLPAWILRSMQTFSRHSTVLEFTLYFLCPGSGAGAWDERTMAVLVALFDPDQRSVIGDFLRLIAEDDALRYWHPSAEFGLKWWAGSEVEPPK